MAIFQGLGPVLWEYKMIGLREDIVVVVALLLTLE
jgi:hypothetical protein